MLEIMTNDYKTLLFISILTGIVVEKLKVILKEKNKKFSTNLLAVMVSVIISTIECISTSVLNNIPFDSILICRTLDIIVISAIMSMVGYDKLKQTIDQVKRL